MPNLFRTFPSKILLFGEYTVTIGSQAFALPLPLYKGGFEKENDQPQKEYNGLELLVDHLRSLPALNSSIDWDLYLQDRNDGVKYHSDIPVGYGLGSSGAIVASFYDRYFINNPNQLNEVKNILGEMESVFHSKSSGIDPLVSYENKAILIGKNGFISSPSIDMSGLNLALIDTKIERSTKKFVSIFNDKLLFPHFILKLEELSDLNEKIIQYALRHNQSLNFTDLFYNISKLQLDIFPEMIPNTFISAWYQGISNESYFLKICGAGGGGMIIAHYMDKEEFTHQFSGYKIYFLE